MEEKIQIRRNSEKIGDFSRFEIRAAISERTIELSDQYLDMESGEWLYLIPPHRRKWRIFDWAEDDESQWFYIKDGMIHGPRMPDELEALINCGYLDHQTLIATVGWSEWIPFDEFNASLVTTEDELKFEAKNVLDSFISGDLVGAGASGAKAAGKLWKWFTESEKITSNWLGVTIMKEECVSAEDVVESLSLAGFAPLNYNIKEDEDMIDVFLEFTDIDEATKVRDTCDLKLEIKGSVFPFSPALINNED